MSKVTHEVSVDGGKYKFIARLGYVIDVDRHGKAWVNNLDAPKAVASLMAELDAARVVVAAVRLIVESGVSLYAPTQIVDALRLHDRLVDDREPPSAWCGGEPDRAAESTVEDRPLLTDNEMVMAHQALNEAGHAGQLIRFAALEKLIAFYKRSTTP